MHSVSKDWYKSTTRYQTGKKEKRTNLEEECAYEALKVHQSTKACQSSVIRVTYIDNNEL